MRVLLDECIDWRLAREIVRHEVRTARQMGWTAIHNGELLARAAAEFDAFVTADQNLSFQQHLPSVEITVIVLKPERNRLVDLRKLVPALLDALRLSGRGQLTIVS